MKKEGFSKNNRIKTYSEFKKLRETGKKSFGEFLILNLMPNNRPFNRIGIAVSKKLFHNSSIRNRLRRLIREAFRRKNKDLKTGFDIIISVSKKKEDLIFKEVNLELSKIFKKAGLLCTDSNGL